MHLQPMAQFYSWLVKKIRSIFTCQKLNRLKEPQVCLQQMMCATMKIILVIFFLLEIKSVCWRDAFIYFGCSCSILCFLRWISVYQPFSSWYKDAFLHLKGSSTFLQHVMQMQGTLSCWLFYDVFFPHSAKHPSLLLLFQWVLHVLL